MYLVFCIPYLVWKHALNLGRVRTAAAVLASWILIFLVVNALPTEFFLPETTIDPVLGARLDKEVIDLARKGKYREAIEVTKELASSYKDSIQLDSLTMSLSLRAYEHAMALTKSPSTATGKDLGWSRDIQRRSADLVLITDQFEVKYSDVPGMLLKVARAQLESGQCERAQTVFEAVYHHRHAILIERVFAGLYLRTMRQEPDDFALILARFGPSDDATFIRSIFASPGITVGMFPHGYGTFADGIAKLQRYGAQLLQQASPPQCEVVASNP